jgi:hypothetical protein
MDPADNRPHRSSTKRAFVYKPSAAPRSASSSDGHNVLNAVVDEVDPAAYAVFMGNRRLDAKAFGLVAAFGMCSLVRCSCGFVGEPGRTNVSEQGVTL